MISNKEYEVLKMYDRGKEVDETKYRRTISSLSNQGMLSYLNCFKGKHYSVQFGITTLGRKAIQEFELFQKEQERKERTLALSEEANRLAAEANKISENALKRSKSANVISIVSCVISVLSIVAAVLVGIFF